MRSDSEIQRDVVEELKWDPRLRDQDVAVSVHGGVLTLAGFSRSLADKYVVEQKAAGIKGVRAIANDITVKLPTVAERSDPEIARAALSALQWHTSVPQDAIQVRVDHGMVTLTGSVDWQYQKDSAEQAIRELTGVTGVTTLLKLKEQPVATDIHRGITAALHRWAQIDAHRITVDVVGHKVVLRGKIRSFAERRDAERAARTAAGVTEVDNQLTIDPSVYAEV
jgi:osmotically-inducible protein OsmY